MLLCKHCIEAIESRGEKIIYDHCSYIETEEAEEMELKCEWCYEVDTLYKCQILDD
jgi:hypothetical protein